MNEPEGHWEIEEPKTAEQIAEHLASRPRRKRSEPVGFVACQSCGNAVLDK